jgi:membrane-associated phospholipid phosphatase
MVRPLALVLACTLLAPPAGAEGAPPAAPADARTPLLPRLTWSPHWARASWHDAWFLAPAGALAGISLLTQRQAPFPSGPALFDDALRPLVRPSTLSQRLQLRGLSDVTLVTGMAWPVLVDALLLAGWAHGSPDVALQLAVSDVEAVAFAVSVQFATAAWVGRERPYGTLCREGGELDPLSHDCASTFARYRSFFSGHATAAFASAGLVCVHNAHLPLYGSQAGGVAACAGALTLALATATLRVSGDQHWPTDVATGAAWGLGVGMALPLLTRYLVPFRPPVQVYANGSGAGVRGEF